MDVLFRNPITVPAKPTAMINVINDNEVLLQSMNVTGKNRHEKLTRNEFRQTDSGRDLDWRSDACRSVTKRNHRLDMHCKDYFRDRGIVKEEYYRMISSPDRVVPNTVYRGLLDATSSC